MWPFYLFSFWTSQTVWSAEFVGFLRCLFWQAKVLSVTASSWKLQVAGSERPTFPDSSFVASCSRTRELDAAPDLEFLLILLADFLVAMSFTRLLDAIGLFAGEELVGSWEDSFIAVDFDFCHTSFSPFCSCILFRHRFGAAYQAGIHSEVYMKWLTLNTWRRFLPSSRVKSLWSMSASWCLVSMYRFFV